MKIWYDTIDQTLAAALRCELLSVWTWDQHRLFPYNPIVTDTEEPSRILKQNVFPGNGILYQRLCNVNKGNVLLYIWIGDVILMCLIMHETWLDKAADIAFIIYI